MVAGRGLQITLLEGLSVPGAVALGDVHVVHVDGYPDVGGGIGDLVIDMLVDEEVVRLRVTILDIVDAGLLDTGEVELHVIVFEVGSPRLGVTLIDFLRCPVGLDAEE